MEQTHITESDNSKTIYKTVVPADRVKGLQHKFNRIAKKAKQHDQTIPTMTVGESFYRNVPLYRDGVDTGETVGIEVVTIEVVASVIKVPGDWRIMGSIKQAPHGETGNLVYDLGADPGFISRSGADKVDPARCDHCQIKRERKRQVILSNGKETMIVGHTCMTEFMGINPMVPVMYSEMMAEMMSAKDYAEWDGVDIEVVWDGPGAFPINQVIDVAAASIDAKGYQPTSARYSTKTEVWQTLTKGRHGIKPHPNTEAALEWAASLEGNTSFEHNMRVVATRSHISYNEAGFAAYLPEAYNRHLAEVAEATIREDQAKDDPGHWGEVKGRFEFSGTVTRVSTGWTTYNWTDRPYSWVDVILDSGHKITWKASKIVDLEPDDEIQGKATVKSHDMWNGAAQTRVTRMTY